MGEGLSVGVGWRKRVEFEAAFLVPWAARGGRGQSEACMLWCLLGGAVKVGKHLRVC